MLKRDTSDPNTKNIYPVCMCLSYLVGQLFDVCWLTQADVFYSLFGSGSVAVGWLRYALCLESPPGGVSSVSVYCKHLATWNAWTIIRRRMEKGSRTKRMSPRSGSTIKKNLISKVGFHFSFWICHTWLQVEHSGSIEWDHRILTIYIFWGDVRCVCDTFLLIEGSQVSKT